MVNSQANLRRKRSFDLTAKVNNGFTGVASFHIIPALLWFTSIAWVVRVTVFVRQRASSDFATVDTAAGIQVLIVFITILLLASSARLDRMLSTVARSSLFLLLVYYLLSAISSIWSADPEFTLYRSIEFLTMFMGALIALSYSPNFIAAERTILKISSIVIILSIYVNLKLTGFSFSLSALHTNSYSASAAMLFCYCLGEYYSSEGKRKTTLRIYGVFAFTALAIGTSSASNIAALCGVLLLFFFYRKFALLGVGLFVLSLLLMLRFVVDIDFAFVRDLLFPGKTDEQISTMTGRLTIWQMFWTYVLESPLIGHGFAVLTSGRSGTFASDPHNSIFSILLGTGFLGFLTFLFLVFKLAREIILTAFRKQPGAIGCAAALVAGLINSMAMPLVYAEWEESSLVFACIFSLFILFVVIPYIKQRRVKFHQAAQS
jgi:O-antigen ligase